MAQRSKSLGAPSRKAILGTARGRMPQVQVLGCRLGRRFCAVHRGVHRTPVLGCRLGRRFCTTHRGVHRTPVLGCRLGRRFCAAHRGVHRTPAPCRLDHRKAVTLRLLLYLFYYVSYNFYSTYNTRT